MKTLLLIPILLLVGCVALNKPLYDRQPEIVEVDRQNGIIIKKLKFLDKFDIYIDRVAVKRHIDIIHAFYTAMELAFVDGYKEKFELMIARINARIAMLNALLKESKSNSLVGFSKSGSNL